eukprot:888396-Rhodomonas_salina.1
MEAWRGLSGDGPAGKLLESDSVGEELLEVAVVVELSRWPRFSACETRRLSHLPPTSSPSAPSPSYSHHIPHSITPITRHHHPRITSLTPTNPFISLTIIITSTSSMISITLVTPRPQISSTLQHSASIGRMCAHRRAAPRVGRASASRTMERRGHRSRRAWGGWSEGRRDGPFLHSSSCSTKARSSSAPHPLRPVSPAWHASVAQE